eukprot:1154257-Pelagomonas_calceolata.AAC.2
MGLLGVEDGCSCYCPRGGAGGNLDEVVGPCSMSSPPPSSRGVSCCAWTLWCVWHGRAHRNISNV